MDEVFHGYSASEGIKETREPSRTDVLLHAAGRAHGDFRLHYSDTVFTAGNGRVWADWAVTGLDRGALVALPFVGWLSQRHRLPVLLGWLQVDLLVNDVPWQAHRTTTWYEGHAVPVSEFVAGEHRVRAWCAIQPEECRLQIGLTVCGPGRAEAVLRGASTLGEEGGSPFDAVNGTIGSCTPLPQELNCTTLPNGIRIENTPACLSAQLLSSTSGQTRVSRDIIETRCRGRVLERQRVSFEMRSPFENGKNGLSSIAFELSLHEEPKPSSSLQVSVIDLSQARAQWEEAWECLEPMATPDALLTSALKRGALYAASLLAPIDETGAAAGLSDHVSWPIDCARDTFHIASSLLFVKPELSRAHLAFTLLDAIPRAGVGKSYVATGESRGHSDARLIDLATYPLLELWRYWRATGDVDFLQQPGVRKTVDTIANQVLSWEDGRTGLLTSTERSSDERCVFPCFVPGNAMFCVCLEHVADMWEQLWNDTDRAVDLRNAAGRLRGAIETHAVVNDPDFGRMFAFEVGNADEFLLYDHADMPNLLSLARLGFCPVTDPVFRNTVRFAYSPRNQGYRGTADGAYRQLCDGSKTMPFSPWPLGTLGKLMSGTADADEAARHLTWLRDALTPALQLPEISDKHTGHPVQRYWFGWPTAMLLMAYVETICGVKPGNEIRVEPLVPHGWQDFASPRLTIRGHELGVLASGGKTTVLLDGEECRVDRPLPV